MQHLSNMINELHDGCELVPDDVKLFRARFVKRMLCVDIMNIGNREERWMVSEFIYPTQWI